MCALTKFDTHKTMFVNASETPFFAQTKAMFLCV